MLFEDQHQDWVNGLRRVNPGADKAIFSGMELQIFDRHKRLKAES